MTNGPPTPPLLIFFFFKWVESAVAGFFVFSYIRMMG